MPTRHVSAEKMEIGRASGGKHWTESEVKARKAAAEGVKRKTRTSLRAPDWLGEDALRIWKRVRRQVAGLELLDNLDADMLGIYCDAVARYKEATQNLVMVGEDGKPVANEEAIKAVQAWARLVAQYADKLGFTPAARARLVKRKADEILDSFGEAFDG